MVSTFITIRLTISTHMIIEILFNKKLSTIKRFNRKLIFNCKLPIFPKLLKKLKGAFLYLKKIFNKF